MAEKREQHRWSAAKSLYLLAYRKVYPIPLFS